MSFTIEELNTDEVFDNNDTIEDIDTDLIDEIDNGSNTNNANNTPIDNTVEVPICFLKGTRILTSNGYKEIEKITKNDSLYTHDERLLKPKSIINYTANEKCKDNIPYKIPKNFLIGDNSCISDLYLSKNHCLLINNVFVPVSSLKFKQCLPKDVNKIEYYNIIMPNFYTDSVIAEGVHCESLCDDFKLLQYVCKDDKRALLSDKQYKKIEKYHKHKGIRKLAYA